MSQVKQPSLQSNQNTRVHLSRDGIKSIPDYAFVLAFLLRFIAAWTNLRPFHPDEHFQTLEYSNFFVNGAFLTTTETYVHLRNLLWPVTLAVPQFLGHLIANSPLGWSIAPIALPRIFMSCLDISILFGWLRLAQNFNPVTKNIMTYVYLFMWCFIEDSLRPSIEHAAAISFWLAIINLTPRNDKKISSFNYYCAGIFTGLTGVVKFPAGLLGLGIIVALVLRTINLSCLRVNLGVNLRINLKQWLFYVIGMASALALGGLIDTLIYGRPYESLWLYLQFNVLSGLAEQIFGHQSALEYLNFFADTFAWELLPVGVWLAIFGVYGTLRGLKTLEPWAFGLTFYLVGHFFPAHKEGRFMFAIFPTVFWAAIYGTYSAQSWVTTHSDQWQKFWSHTIFSANFVKKIILCLVILHCGQVLVSLRGELWKPRIDFFAAREVGEKLRACAVLTVHNPLTYELPLESYQNLSPVAQIMRFGKLDIEAGWSSQGLNLESPKIPFDGWIGMTPRCALDAPVVVHTRRVDPIWNTLGCASYHDNTFSLTSIYLSFGQFFSKEIRPGAIYLCKQNFLDKLIYRNKDQVIPYIIKFAFPKLSNMPPYGLSSIEFINFINTQFGVKILSSSLIKD